MSGTFAAQGANFAVNGTTTGTQANPAVSRDSDGDFVAVWNGPESDADGGIMAQRYNSVGTAQSSNFTVNDYTSGAQQNPAVSSDSDRLAPGAKLPARDELSQVEQAVYTAMPFGNQPADLKPVHEAVEAAFSNKASRLEDDGFVLSREGQVALVNVFGSWCVACVIEHPMLMRLSRDGEGAEQNENGAHGFVYSLGTFGFFGADLPLFPSSEYLPAPAIRIVTKPAR